MAKIIFLNYILGSGSMASCGSLTPLQVPTSLSSHPLPTISVCDFTCMISNDPDPISQSCITANLITHSCMYFTSNIRMSNPFPRNRHPIILKYYFSSHSETPLLIYSQSVKMRKYWWGKTHVSFRTFSSATSSALDLV